MRPTNSGTLAAVHLYVRTYKSAICLTAILLWSLSSSVPAEPIPEVAFNLTWETDYLYGFVTTADGSIYGGRSSRIAKMDNHFNVLWSREMGGLLAVHERKGSVYVAGGYPLTNSLTSFPLIVTKLDSTGTVLWTTQSTGKRLFDPQNIGSDAAGNVYVAGVWQGEQADDPSPYFGYPCNFLRKFDSGGRLMWERRSLRTFFYAGGKSVWAVVDAAGSTIMSAAYNSIYPFGETNPTQVNNIESQPFLAKYDAEGNVTWLKHIVTTNYGVGGVSLALDRTGAFWISGWQEHSFTLDGTSFTMATNTRGFLAKLSHDGHVLIAIQSSIDSPVYFHGCATDEIGNVYVAGEFYGSLGLAGTNITGTYGSVVAKFSSAGALRWVYQITNSLMYFPDFQADIAGNVYLGTRHSILKLHTTGPPLYFSSDSSSPSLSWSVLAEHFTLETSPSLEESSWAAVPANSITTNSTWKTAVLPSSSERQFFRLRRFP
jgi:hypothetical protein